MRSRTGSTRDTVAFVSGVDYRSMQPTIFFITRYSDTAMEFDLAHGTAVLERTPQTMRAMLFALPASWVDATDGPETWSPYVIVGHLIHGERTDWIPRAKIILAQGANRRFVPFDRFAQLRESSNKWVVHDLGHVAQCARVMATQYREAVGPWRRYLTILDR